MISLIVIYKCFHGLTASLGSEKHGCMLWPTSPPLLHVTAAANESSDDEMKPVLTVMLLKVLSSSWSFRLP